ncbi:MAG: PaaI family thioesterase [Rhodospirillaceae bacterium]
MTEPYRPALDPTKAKSAEEFNRILEGFQPAALGVKILEASPEKVIGSLPAEKRTMAPTGYMHAASVVTLADTLAGIGCFMNLPPGSTGFTTIELKCNLMGTVLDGVAMGEATPVHLGRSTHVWDARIYHPKTEKTVALFRCTQMVLWPKG